jgi:hypothetical protein
MAVVVAATIAVSAVKAIRRDMHSLDRDSATSIAKTVRPDFSVGEALRYDFTPAAVKDPVRHIANVSGWNFELVFLKDHVRRSSAGIASVFCCRREYGLDCGPPYLMPCRRRTKRSPSYSWRVRMPPDRDTAVD